MLFADAFFFHPALTGDAATHDGGGAALYELREGAEAHLSATDHDWLLTSSSSSSSLLVVSPRAGVAAQAAAAVREAVLALIEQAVRQSEWPFGFKPS